MIPASSSGASFFARAEASAKRVTGDTPQGTMGRVQIERVVWVRGRNDTFLTLSARQRWIFGWWEWINPLKQWILRGHVEIPNLSWNVLFAKLSNFNISYKACQGAWCWYIFPPSHYPVLMFKEINLSCLKGIMLACIFTHLLTLQTTEQIFECWRFAVETNVSEKKQTVMRCYSELNMP